MTNNAQLLPLPEPDFTSFQVDSTMRRDELRSFSASQMQSYALACIEAAKPADALGSLPVVAEVSGNGGWHIKPIAPELHIGMKLADHAQATAEIAKRDAEIERLKYQLGGGELAAQELERQVDYLRAKLAGVDGLVEALRKISDTTGNVYVGGLESVKIARESLDTYEAAQGEKT